ncbi:MAG: transcription antitermination factor NusB [Gemmataceae bacterium]
MTKRRKAREVALQLLFERDRNSTPMSPAMAATFARDRLVGERESAAFALDLANQVGIRRPEIDALLTATAQNWRLHRMTPVDRNVLRMAVYELRFANPVLPTAVAIDEAIELARRYGTTESPSFVNGILDQIAKASPPASAPASAPTPAE